MSKKPSKKPATPVQVSTQQIYPTREQWLEAAVSEFSSEFTKMGHSLPDLIKVSCAFTSGGTRKHGGKSMIGECWDASRSAQGAFEIFISPVEDEPVQVLATLAHELCHATAGLQAGHRGTFAKLARGLDLEGALTATYGGKKFEARVTRILKELGTYPHAALDTSTRTKQTTRLIKCQCATCGYTVRVTQTWLAYGSPVCPNSQIGVNPDGSAAIGTGFPHGAMAVC